MAVKKDLTTRDMNIEDEKEKLAELFFQCARYERPSTDWKTALDKLVANVRSAENYECALVAQTYISQPEVIADCIQLRLTTLPATGK